MPALLGSRAPAAQPSLLLALLLVSAGVAVAPPAFTCALSNDATVCAILGEFYVATSGAGWAGSIGWVFAAAGMAADYCAGGSFQGVACDTGGIITQLCVRMPSAGEADCWRAAESLR